MRPSLLVLVLSSSGECGRALTLRDGGGLRGVGGEARAVVLRGHVAAGLEGLDLLQHRHALDRDRGL
eukprot:568868-Rhodomonas_salina.1